MRKTYLFFTVILSVYGLFPLNGFSQNDTQFGLPFGVKACLGKGMINDIAFYPDGRKLAIASDSGIWKYNVDTGKETNISNDWIQMLELSADGTILASIETFWQPLSNRIPSDKIRLYDTNTGHTSSISTEHRNGIYSLALSRDGRTLASGGEGAIQLWDTDTGRFLSLLRGHTNTVWELAFSADGTLLASGSEDNTIKLWSTSNGQQMLSISTGYTSSRFALTFSQDGKTLVSGSPDGKIHLWDARTGRLRSTLIGHKDRIISLVISPDGRTLASGSLDNTIRLWNMRTHRKILTITQHTDWVRSLAFSQDGMVLASASGDKTLRFWEITTGRQLSLNNTGHWGSITALAFSQDGSMLASVGGYWDKKVYLWNTNIGDNLFTLKGHKSSGKVLVFSKDDKTLACGYDDGTILLWDVDTGRLQSSLTKYVDPQPYSTKNTSIDALTFSHDGKMLASESSFRTVLWDVQSGQHLSTYVSKIYKPGNALAFSSNNSTLATVDVMEKLRIFDVSTGKMVRSTNIDNIQVFKFSFSTYATTLLGICPWRSEIRLWDVQTGNFLKSIPLQRSTNKPLSSDVDSSGKWTISTDWTTLIGRDSNSFDTIHLWDARTGNKISSVKSDWDSISVLGLSPDGRILATGYSNGTILLREIRK